MVDRRSSCALCGLRAPLPASRTIKAEEKHFCCEGCARVYELADESGLLEQILTKPAAGRRPVASLAGPSETAYFSLKGMWCTGCATAAEALLRHQPGVRNVDISFASERGRISYDPGKTSASSLLARLESLGYQARVLSDRAHAGVERRLEGILLQLIVAVAFGMQVMIIYLAFLYHRYSQGDYASPEVRTLQYLALGLTLPVLFVGGLSFLRGAWRALLARRATMDTLVALGTLSAFVYSTYATISASGATYFDSATMITTFVMIGRYLESLGGSRARRDLNALLDLQPDYAWTRIEDAWVKVDAAGLTADAEILIKAGERIPADCTVIDGAGAVDESLLTGESFPLDKEAGDRAMAGTLLLDGSLVARTTGPVAGSRLAKISRLMEETLATKPRSQRIADRASAYFAVGIIVVAVASFAVRLALGRPAPGSFIAAITVLVVACPCALGLATPLALTVSLSAAARAGVLVRNPAALELAAKVSRVVFDKTGTVTRGRLTVDRVIVLDHTLLGPGPWESPAGDPGRRLLCLAAAVEQFSGHPLAQAIVAACQGPLPAATDFEAIRGRGCGAIVPSLEGARVRVGSPAYLGLDADVLPAGPAPSAEQDQAAVWGTTVWVARDDRPVGSITLRDELNPTAREAFAALAKQNIKTSILSGDARDPVGSVALEVGAGDHAGGLGPEAKLGRIRLWQGEGEVVAVVGDGVNDAPALAQADLAVAMAEGADLTADAADVIVTRGDLTLVPWFIKLSARTRKDIRQNLSWAFAYNAVAIPLAVAGLVSPIIAAGAMATSSLLVVGNSLRLGRRR